MKIDLNAMGYDELIAYGEEVMRMIRLRAYGEGYRQGKFDADMDAEPTPESDDYPYGITDEDIQEAIKEARRDRAQARRDEIVEQAKADLENLADEDGPVYQTEDNEGYQCSCYASFRVNKEHRTVACDLRGVRTGERYKRGIAKAAPDDCFNVHIGKAIALRRALGLAVPDEYLKAPQPTEVRVGDVVRSISKLPKMYRIVKDRLNANEAPLGSIVAKHGRIIDDSREEVGGE
ncbi:hypothetical protein [Bacillus subtilis]|uniref:hypothetical protein n=1 Tax=Bacillus subtilis TaxID=1423 RepID=UPI0023EB56FB|nr:hypothetical protein [Bacillus subtilis]MDF4197356.1 hypothetical protein [Bacillus subtilis]MDF4219273.1 hypothetical protein [Bacillus subtilis]